MIDFLAALGLLLAIEGIIFAAFPQATQRMLSEASQSPTRRMRRVGVASAIIGVTIIWIVRWSGIF